MFGTMRAFSAPHPTDRLRHRRAGELETRTFFDLPQVAAWAEESAAPRPLGLSQTILKE